jgi:ribosome-binding protein aMBF1 (putative translation factor)
MTANQLIEMALAYSGLSQADLARRLGWSPQLLNKRIKTGKFSIDEWEAIAEAMGAKFNIGFTFPDGRQI